MSFPARGQLEIFTCPRGASPEGKYISRVDRGSGKHFLAYGGYIFLFFRGSLVQLRLNLCKFPVWNHIFLLSFFLTPGKNVLSCPRARKWTFLPASGTFLPGVKKKAQQKNWTLGVNSYHLGRHSNWVLEFIGYGFSVGYIRGYIREYNRLFFTR